VLDPIIVTVHDLFISVLSVVSLPKLWAGTASLASPLVYTEHKGEEFTEPEVLKNKQLSQVQSYFN